MIPRKNKLGVWIRDQIDLGKSTGELCAMLDLTPAELSRYKHGRRSPSREHLPGLYKATGLTVWELMGLPNPDEWERVLPARRLANEEVLEENRVRMTRERMRAVTPTVGDEETVIDMPAEPPKLEKAPPVKPPTSPVVPRLTPERVQVAIRHRLPAGSTWAAFLHACETNPETIDSQWLAWCETYTPSPVVLDAPAERPEPQLYDHLRPLERRDFRPAPGPFDVRFVPKE